MELTGRLYYRFTSAEVWRFYRMLLTAQQEGAQFGLDWKPFPDGGVPAGRLDGEARLMAAAEVVRQDVPLHHGGFVQAILTAIHSERTDVDDADLLPVAARVAEIDGELLSDAAIQGPGRALLEAAYVEADSLGVDDVPTIYRHGPVLHVRTSGAAALGGARERLETISRMLDDDGLWELRKP